MYVLFNHLTQSLNIGFLEVIDKVEITDNRTREDLDLSVSLSLILESVTDT